MRCGGLGTEQEYEEDEVIFHQGDEGDEFFIISSGNALVFINDEDGNPTVEVNRMTEKQSFGELALRGEGKRSATIKAGKGGAALLKMTKGCFDSIMDTKTKSGEWTTATSRTNTSSSSGKGLVWNSKSQLPPVKLNVGDKVRVKLKQQPGGGKRPSTQVHDAKLVRSGTVTRVVSGGSKASIKFDDGGPEKTNVKREDIFLVLKAGARVAVRYGGGQRWYSSKVLQCSPQDDLQGLETYNVEFDDGEVQFAVKREHVWPLLDPAKQQTASLRRGSALLRGSSFKSGVKVGVQMNAARRSSTMKVQPIEEAPSRTKMGGTAVTLVAEEQEGGDAPVAQQHRRVLRAK